MKGKKRSPCPIACALDILGDKWTLLVVRDLASGKSQFKDFSRSPEKIASNILTDRLNRLVAHKLVEKFALDDQPGRDAYRLTDKGRTLQPVLQALATWSLTHVQGTAAHIKPSW